MEAASCRSRAEWKSIETAKGVVTLLGISLVKCAGVDEDEVVCRNALALIRSFRKVLDQLLSYNAYCEGFCEDGILCGRKKHSYSADGKQKW